MIDWKKLEAIFSSKGFDTSFFETKEDATDYLSSKLKGMKIGIGGSMTVKELSLYEKLIKDNEVIWHWVDNSRETRTKELTSDVFILSANGVSSTGEIVNIDGVGNRLAASLYGPEKVIYVIGRNKIEPTLEKAIYRARNVAAVKNAERFSTKTPCNLSDKKHCYDCKSTERICNAFVIITNPMKGQKVELVFIDEDLGY